jgi:microsomal epoxide hydrolase
VGPVAADDAGEPAVERAFTDIRRWSVMPKGGHFAALEQPAALAREIRAFFRPLD